MMQRTEVGQHPSQDCPRAEEAEGATLREVAWPGAGCLWPGKEGISQVSPWLPLIRPLPSNTTPATLAHVLA